jgi:predicted  nucleic acid-binding Zn-ribbon protein
MENNKTFSLTLSPQVILGIILTALPIIGGGAYLAITRYNEAVSAIEEVKGIGDMKSEINTLTIQLKSQQERIASLQDASIRMQEKSSDALASSREAQALAKGNTQEINAAITSMQEQMKALRRATTNPLGS